MRVLAAWFDAGPGGHESSGFFRIASDSIWLEPSSDPASRGHLLPQAGEGSRPTQTSNGCLTPLSPSLADARRVLRAIFGHDDFRPGQEQIVAAILDGRDVLAVMPTGAGKSLLYQLPAAMGLAPVVVVSPLISLMRDQLRGLQACGVAAVALHSGQSEDENTAAIASLMSGRAKLVYVAPERLAQDGTIDLLRAARIKLLAVDEAHCVSHWGHEFRPDYGRLGDIARALGAPRIVAVTATAGRETRADIVAKLFVRAPEIFVSSFARANLRLAFARRRRRCQTQIGARERRHEHLRRPRE